jgi:hypothetical protein
MNADEVVTTVFGNTDDAAKAVDHVFAVLEATYCAAWARSLGTAPIGTIKTVWAYQLGQFTHSNAAKRCILWALKNPLDSPPSAVQFRNLCRSAPGTAAVLELPRPPQDPVMVAAIVKGLKGKTVVNGMKDWAHRLKARHDTGERLNSYQISCYQAALA